MRERERETDWGYSGHLYNLHPLFVVPWGRGIPVPSRDNPCRINYAYKKNYYPNHNTERKI